MTRPMQYAAAESNLPPPPTPPEEVVLLLLSELFGLLDGELLPEAVALFCIDDIPASSSQDEVEDPDSSSEDRVGG